MCFSSSTALSDALTPRKMQFGMDGVELERYREYCKAHPEEFPE